MHWLVAIAEGFPLLTSHDHLAFIFDPLGIVTDLSQTSIRKVLLWAVLLSSYNYAFYHISGDDNVWADILGRWSAPVIHRLVLIPPLTSTKQDGLKWPFHASIKLLQDTAALPETCEIKDSLWCLPTEQILIPSL